MKKIQLQKIILVIAILLGMPVATFADEAQMKETMIQIIQQLESIKPLIQKAESEQPKDARIKVEFETFTDSEGNAHNGLLEDIEEMQSALIEVVNQNGLEERSIAPVKNDFVE